MFAITDEYNRNRLKELIEKGERPTIVGGFIDFFGDAKVVSCSICQVPVFVRPWLYETIHEHNLKTICICCAPPQDLTGQILVDTAKLETLFEQQLRKEELALIAEIKQKWTCETHFSSPLSQTNYSIWRSPDNKIEVEIHDADNELVCLHIIGTSNWMINMRDIKRVVDRFNKGLLP